MRPAARPRRDDGRLRHHRDRQRRDGQRAAADVGPARPRPAGVRAGRVRWRGSGPRQPAGVRDGHRQDHRPAEPGHVLGARAAAQRPAPRLLAYVLAADGDRRRDRHPGAVRPARGRGPGDAPARGCRRRRRPDRMPGRDAVRRAELRPAHRAAAPVHRTAATWPPPRPISTTLTSAPTGSPRRPNRPRSSNLRLAAIGAIPPWVPRTIPAGAERVEPKETRQVYFAETSGFTATPIYDRAHFGQATRLSGPCIVEEMDSTTVIHPGYAADLDPWGNLVIGPSDGEQPR